MGLLDAFNTGNPERDAATRHGLLQMGLALLQGKGNLGSIIGQAGMHGLQGMQQFQGNQFNQQMRAAQLEDIKRKRVLEGRQDTLDSLPGQYIKPEQMGVDATGGMETASTAPNNYVSPQMDLAGLAQRYMQTPGGLQTGMGLMQFAAPKPRKLMDVAPGATVIDETGKPVFSSPPKAEDKPSPVQQYEYAVKQGYKGSYEKWVTDMAKAGASSVNVGYGAPVAGVNEKGDPVFFQPPKSGVGAPAIVQGVKPAPQNRDTKLPAEIQRMNIAADTMDKMLTRYEDMLKQHNPRDPTVQASPAVRAEFQSLMKGIQLQFKEVQALGALTGPDVAIMEAAITDPFTFKGAFYGQGGLQSQIKQARALLKERKEATARSQGKPDDKPPDNDPLGLFK